MEQYNNTKARNKKGDKNHKKKWNNNVKEPVEKHGKFAYPSKEKRDRAVGIRQEKDGNIIQYLELVKDLFDPVKIPKPGDWLWEESEGGGETYDQFVYSGYRHTPTNHKKTIYLVPIGHFVEARSPSLEILKNFAEFFLCLPVQLLPNLNISIQQNSAKLTIPDALNKSTHNRFKVNSRMNENERQLLTKDLNKALKYIMPKDAFCILGLTMWDLYPQESWNFVFGEASIVERSGVFSFARYDPTFNTKDRLTRTENFAQEEYNELLLESCETMIHEIMHLFGIQHCIFFDCCMNGSNHLAEKQPLHLCAVDLHKLRLQINFDFIERDKNLLAFFMSHLAFEKEAKFTQNLLNHVEAKLNQENIPSDEEKQ